MHNNNTWMISNMQFDEDAHDNIHKNRRPVVNRKKTK